MFFENNDENKEFDIEKYLIDIPSFLENNKITNPLDIDPSLFTKDELSKRPHMEWLSTVECNLFHPQSENLEEQNEQLNNFLESLKKDAVFLDAGFCPSFPENFKEPVIAVDTETTGLDTRLLYDYDKNIIINTKLVGVCLAVSDMVGYYLPVLNNQLDGISNWNLSCIINFMNRIHQEFFCVYHFSQYDREVLAVNGVTDLRPWPYFADTQLLNFFNDCNEKTHNLKFLSEKLLGRKMIQIEELFEESGAIEKTKKKEKPVISFDRISASVGYVYAVSDSINTMGLFKYFASQPQEINMFFHQHVPLTVDHKMVDTLRNLYRNGLPINLEYCQYATKDLTYRIKLLEKEIHQLVGREFDISSPQQLSEILFDEFEIPPLSGMERGKPTKKYPKGLYSTAEETLDELFEKNPEYKILRYVVTYRKLNVALTRLFFKMIKNSYVDSILPFTKVQLSFSQTVIPTGRLASSSSKGAERVQVIEHKNGKLAYKYDKGGWTCGFNAQGVNNPFFILKSAKKIKKIPFESNLNLENPYPEEIQIDVIKQLVGKDK